MEMSESHLLTLGFIPPGHAGGTISCGDPDGSGTREITVEIGEDAARNLDADVSIPTADATFFSENCPLWARIASEWGTPLADGGGSLSAGDLARCWGLFQEEPLDGPAPRIVAEEDDCGEFQNASGEASGKFYVRYQFEEDGEYFNEKVVIV
jgi:hypothetical protein